ncbi:hypothetical protein B0H13DRAFT_1862092 [Mycena leptocephala]|nr:hypothetical protein B0H13DRAFT_1862092 [Mycena leptocephala]
MDSSLWRIYISLPAWKEFCSVEDAKPENKDATRAYSDLYHDAESHFLSPRSLHLAATTEAYRNVLGRIHDPLILEMISVVIKTYNTSSILQKLVQERWLELHGNSSSIAKVEKCISYYHGIDCLTANLEYSAMCKVVHESTTVDWPAACMAGPLVKTLWDLTTSTHYHRPERELESSSGSVAGLRPRGSSTAQRSIPIAPFSPSTVWYSLSTCSPSFSSARRSCSYRSRSSRSTARSADNTS